AIGGTGRHAHSLPSAPLDDPFGLELAVGLTDSHRVDIGSLGDPADTGKVIAADELTARDHRQHLIDDLPINGDPARGGDFELAGACVHVYQYSDTLRVGQEDS